MKKQMHSCSFCFVNACQVCFDSKTVNRCQFSSLIQTVLNCRCVFSDFAEILLAPPLVTIKWNGGQIVICLSLKLK